VTQLSLLDSARRAERPWKRQRSTARAVYAEQRARDEAKRAIGKETREGQVLRCLAWHWNENQASPTALELLTWMSDRGERVFDINGVRPRITALVEAGIVESAGQRKCSISGKRVHIWRVREIGGIAR
jgi:hypothetical protein